MYRLYPPADPTASIQRPVTTCNGGEGTDWNVSTKSGREHMVATLQLMARFEKTITRRRIRRMAKP
jgi:hypothetical protein